MICGMSHPRSMDFALGEVEADGDIASRLDGAVGNVSRKRRHDPEDPDSQTLGEGSWLARFGVRRHMGD